MGNTCGNDEYKTYKKRHESTLQQYIMAQKKQQYMHDKISKLKQDLNKRIKEEKERSLQQIQSKSTEVEQAFSKEKASLITGCPSGISVLEVQKGASVEELLGLKEFRAKTASFNDNVISKFNSTEQSVQKEIEDLKTEEINEIQKSKPKLQGISLSKKDQFLKRAQRDYKQQITQAEEEMKDKYGDKLESSYYIETFRRITSKDSLNKWVQVAKDKFTTNSKILLED